MEENAKANKLGLELNTATTEVLVEINKVVPRRRWKFVERHRTMTAQ